MYVGLNLHCTLTFCQYLENLSGKDSDRVTLKHHLAGSTTDAMECIDQDTVHLYPVAYLHYPGCYCNCTGEASILAFSHKAINDENYLLHNTATETPQHACLNRAQIHQLLCSTPADVSKRLWLKTIGWKSGIQQTTLGMYMDCIFGTLSMAYVATIINTNKIYEYLTLYQQKAKL